MRSLIVVVIAIVAVIFTARPALRALDTAITGSPCSHAFSVPPELQLPRVVPPGEPVEIERTMLAYLSSYRYRDLGWCVDKSVRDTGPYVDGISYGTHPAVRIYYSPEMMDWLRNGRQGVPRDGAVIIKEQYGDKPAEYFKHASDEDLRPTDWTIMIRRSSASRDGWFWGELYVGMFAAGPRAATAYPNAGFGIYCLRCHASAQRAMTFSSLENIEGFPGKPLTYFIDNSWRKHAAAAASAPTVATPEEPLAVQTFPPETLDTYVAHAHVPHMFMTSDQCESCHGASPGKPFGPVMWVKSTKRKAAGLNVSEYGEWRWSPMALAGRDPVFYAQLESEMAFLASVHQGRDAARLQRNVTNLCMTCHGVMGKRALVADHPGATFDTSIVFDGNPADKNFHYGGMARDGISCALCHHVVPAKPPRGTAPLPYFLKNEITGNLDLGPADQIFGPFASDQIATHPMKQALGTTPRHDSYIESSELCGSCHTVNLPVLDHRPTAAAPTAMELEQATYLEWLNSAYQTEYAPKRGALSCQACHMPEGVTDAADGVNLAHIVSKIAFVQDQSYPPTTNAVSERDLNVRLRKTGFHRHELLGLNAFLLQMFAQYPNVLGVRTNDYMSGSSSDLADAMDHVITQARTKTARVRVRIRVVRGRLIADVETINLTGHRFPSGVAFRRAFLDVEVRDTSAPASAPPLFASGRTNAQGYIVGANGLPLPSESFARDAAGRQQYQPHFDEALPITRPDQVEIFEELTRDAAGNFTTTFTGRDDEVKDNRLLPLGWTRTGPTPSLPQYYLEATYPKGGAARDPRYRDGRGHAVVRYIVTIPPGVNPAHLRVVATLYYQSFAPYFLEARTQRTGPAAVRLAALVKHLKVANGPLRDWKIRIASASAIAP